MANHRVTVKQLKNHFAYSWWKYLLLLLPTNVVMPYNMQELTHF